MDIALYIEVLKTTFMPYIKSIQGFRFYYNNPLFWVFFMALFLALEIGRSWSVEKAFLFCVSAAAVLLGATWLERSIAETFVKPGESFDPFIIRVFTFIAVSAVTIYFVMIDNS